MPANSSHVALHAPGRGDSTVESNQRDLISDHFRVDSFLVSNLPEEGMWHKKNRESGVLAF